MGWHIHKNNLQTTVAVARNAGDSTLIVATGTGALFGNPSTDNPIRVSIRRLNTPICILEVTAIAGDVMTVAGAIEGTTDQAMITGDFAWNACTAGDLDDLEAALDSLSGNVDGGTYTNATPMPSTLGGLPAGHTFAAESITQVFNELLYPYQYPAFTSFVISGQSTAVEVGTSITGSHTFTWTTSNPTNVNADTIAIADQTTSTTLGSGLADNGSFVATLGVTHNAPASEVWGISGTNSQSGSFARTFTVGWQWLEYYGESASPELNASQVQGLRVSQLSPSSAGSYSFNAGGYKFFAWATSIAAPAGFKDVATQLNVAMADPTIDSNYSNSANGLYFMLFSVTNSHGIATTYRVYRTAYVLGGSITIGVS